MGSVGGSYDNALGATISGPDKTKAIYNGSSWKRTEQVDLASLNWVNWINDKRLLESIRGISLVEQEENDYRQLSEDAAI